MTSSPVSPQPLQTSRSAASISLLWARVLVFGTSAAVLVLEILAGRLMAPYLGVTLETFTGIIGVVLAGIATGAWLGGWMADRTAPKPLLGPILVVSGLLTIMVPTLVDLGGPYMRRAGPIEIVALTSFAFLLPSLTLSTIPTIVVKLRLRSLDETGSVVGSLSALSTFGALFGTFITGFVLLATVPTRPLVLTMGVGLVLAGAVLLAHTSSRKNAMLGGLLAIVAAFSFGFSEGPCDEQTPYFCVVIWEDSQRPDGRILWLDTLTHSYVDLSDPTYLSFEYVQAMAALIDGLPEGPLDVGYIGGGAFTLPRYVDTVRPGSISTVFELDGVLVELVKEHFGLVLTDTVRAKIGDARLNLPDHLDGAFDLVIGDAFGGLSVPWHLTTREFLHEIDRVLTADGIYAVNVIDYPPYGFARAQVVTMMETFQHVAVAAPEHRFSNVEGGNIVIFASHVPFDLERLTRDVAERTGSYLLLDGVEAQSWAGDARVLRDDFAPVDQLLGKRDW